MNHKPLWISLLAMLFIATSCGNDIKLLNPDQKRTYVIFGTLNSGDPLQQVKVRMTSITDAAITDISIDSSEFSAPENLQVSIQEWQNDTYATFQMTPVTYSKEPGIFMNTRNNLYETLITPDKDMVYKLVITNPENGDLVTAKVLPMPAPKLGSPTWSWVRYNFSDPADPFNVRFKEVPRAYVYLIRFTIRYIEVNVNGDTLVREGSAVLKPRYVDDPPEYSPKRENLGNEYNHYMTRGYTYNIFDQVIPDRPDVNFRQLICFEIALWAGDQHLRYYTEFTLKFNDNRKQIFTNINNGIGFFGACSHTDCTGVLPDQAFMDSLAFYNRTARLKFKTDLYRPNGQTLIPLNSSFQTLIPEISYGK